MTGELENPEPVTPAAEFPGWRVWKRADDPRHVGWLLGSGPPHLVYAATMNGLRETIGRETDTR